MQYCNTQTKKDDFKTNNPPFKNQAREPTFRLLMLARDMSLYYYFLVNVDRLVIIYLSIIRIAVAINFYIIDLTDYGNPYFIERCNLLRGEWDL